MYGLFVPSLFGCWFGIPVGDPHCRRKNKGGLLYFVGKLFVLLLRSCWLDLLLVAFLAVRCFSMISPALLAFLCLSGFSCFLLCHFCFSSLLLAFHCFSVVAPAFLALPAFCACFAFPCLFIGDFSCCSFCSCFFCACLALPNFSPAFLYFPASCPLVAYWFPDLIAFAIYGLCCRFFLLVALFLLFWPSTLVLFLFLIF